MEKDLDPELKAADGEEISVDKECVALCFDGNSGGWAGQVTLIDVCFLSVKHFCAIHEWVSLFQVYLCVREDIYYLSVSLAEYSPSEDTMSAERSLRFFFCTGQHS